MVGAPNQPEVDQLELQSALWANFAQWLDELAFLEELYLGSNQLSGSIPPELGQLTSLGSLGLSENQFSGSIPDDLGQPGRVAR